jgi:hypothetical protein
MAAVGFVCTSQCIFQGSLNTKPAQEIKAVKRSRMEADHALSGIE